MPTLFRTKSIAELIAASDHPSHRLKKTLGLGSLIALGIGIVVGSGIFTLTGTAAAGLKFDYPSIFKAPLLNLLISGQHAVGTFGRPGAGPAISISFLLVALACSFAALCYAELASMIPVSGSAYTYAYATMGEIFAWIIGWDLILEYAVGNMAVAVGFGAYFNDLLDNAFGFHLPFQLTQPIFIEGKTTGAWFNLPSFLLVMLLTWLLVRGVRESARTNTIIVLIKVGAILLFIFGAARSVDAHNWHPFMPNGYSGVLTGAAIVFFSYIGFDALSTSAEECHTPQRDLPRGIMFTLVICALLYAGVALVLTGIVHWDTLNNDAPVANALKAVGLNRLRFVVTVGALMGMLSSVLVGQYGQTRILFAMSRDRLLPGMFASVHPQFKTPGYQHLDRGYSRGDACRRLGHRHLRRPHEYRYSLRLRGGLRGRDSVAALAAGSSARFPRAVGAVSASIVHPLLPHSDVEFAARNVDPFRGMAGRRPCDLFRIRPQAGCGVTVPNFP